MSRWLFLGLLRKEPQPWSFSVSSVIMKEISHRVCLFCLDSKMPFSHFFNMAQLGEIWPNTTARFTVVFKPDEAKLYQETIYCDVTGKCMPGIHNLLS